MAKRPTDSIGFLDLRPDQRQRAGQSTLRARLAFPEEGRAWLEQRGYREITLLGQGEDGFLQPYVVSMRDRNGEEWRAFVYENGRVAGLTRQPRRGHAWPYALRGWGSQGWTALEAENDQDVP